MISKSYPPIIKNVDETINEFIEQRASICRFGDGELNLICNNSIPFQVVSSALSKRLIDILSSHNDKIFIAIPRVGYYRKNLTDINKKFWRSSEVRFRSIVERDISIILKLIIAQK
ncbi:DUF1792 domain-containing protein [Brenneria sp. 4F2]|nr:DUF1792 domain-containing protein [Brenneria bubanii]